MSKPAKKIVILGGGTAGWMAANLFAHKWSKHNIQITLVESPDVATIGVGEGSTPSLKRFFEQLGIAESQWMTECNATYKLNIRFKDWSPQSGIASYSHPFPSEVDVFTSRAFQVNCQTRRLGLATHTAPEDFLLNGVLAKQGKSPITPANFPFKMEYGYHFDSHLLGAFLAKHAQSLGVIHRKEHIVDVEKHSSGDIDALITKNEQRIDADFFVDCTGFSSLLMQKILGVKFNSYRQNLFKSH